MSARDEAGPAEVLAAERALQAAMRASDVAALDRLLHPELLAVGPDGLLVGKATDLAAHRDGIFRIAELEERTWVRDGGAWWVVAAHIAPAGD